MPPPIRVTSAEDDRFVVRFPYDRGRVDKIKTIPGAQWHAKEKFWSLLPFPRALHRLVELFTDRDIDVAPGLEEFLPKRKEARPSVPPPAPGPTNPFPEMVEEAGREMRLRGFSPKTRKVYRNHIQAFLSRAATPPEARTEMDIRTYLLHLVDE